MISSQRLTLIPLTYGQVFRYLQNNGYLESKLSLDFIPRLTESELKEVVEAAQSPQFDLHPEVLFTTIWIVIDTAQNIMVADLCFYGIPDKDGEVEIGYGTFPEHQKRGYMREAVGLIINWAKEREDIKAIKAKCEKQNLASARILAFNGFNKISQDELLYYWKILTK